MVTVQARKGRWSEKREAHQARASDAFIEKHAERMADRQAEISDRALDAIDEAITRFRADLRATRPVRQADGSIAEEPVMVIGPKDLAVLIDRLQVLLDRPSSISQHQGVTITSDVSTDALREFVGQTRGWAGPAPEASPIPRLPRRLDD